MDGPHEIRRDDVPALNQVFSEAFTERYRRDGMVGVRVPFRRLLDGLATPADLRAATDAILADLVVGAPDFDVAVDGTAVLNERERGHMRDVRGVFIGFFAVALVLTAGAIAIAARRDMAGRRASWAAARGGAVGLVVVLVMAGAVALVAFDALFETFHRLFFPSGSYTFDPSTDRLVQLFPFRFWQETAIAVGVVSVVVAAVVAGVASRRLARGPEPSATPATLLSSRP